MTKSNTNKSAAPARARAMLSATTLALAAVVALEVTGMQALSQDDAAWATAAAADGETIYTSAKAEHVASVDIRIVAQSTN